MPAMDDISKSGEWCAFTAEVAVETAIAEDITVFLVEADTPEDHVNETNLHKKAVIMPYAAYVELVDATGDVNRPHHGRPCPV